MTKRKLDDPAMLVYVSTWLAHAVNLSAEATGWHFNLIAQEFDKEGLPDDVDQLARLALVQYSEYKKFISVWEKELKQYYVKNEEGRLVSHFKKNIWGTRKPYSEKRTKTGCIGAICRLGYVNDMPHKIACEIKTHLNKLELSQLEEIKENKETINQYIEGLLKQNGEAKANLIYKNKNKDNIDNKNKNKSNAYVHPYSDLFLSWLNEYGNTNKTEEAWEIWQTLGSGDYLEIMKHTNQFVELFTIEYRPNAAKYLATKRYKDDLSKFKTDGDVSGSIPDDLAKTYNL